MACNFKCLIETEGLLKVTGSHVHTLRVVIISSKVQDIDIATIFRNKK